MKDVVKHAISVINPPPKSYLWLLQPTSPFRTTEDFDCIFNLLEKAAPNSLISVCEVGANHPHRMYTVGENSKTLSPLRRTNFKNKQDLLKTYIRNGCFYVVNVEKFLENETFDIHPCLPYYMPEDQSINIDSPWDLEVARLKASKEGKYL